MDLESLRNYCLSKKLASEDMPFGEDTLVFRVLGKIFALTSLDLDTEGSNPDKASGCRVNLKCNPDYAIELREKFVDIQPGYHMNKKHWNTVYCENGLDSALIKSLIDHSYDLIVQSMTKAQRDLL